MKIFGARFRQYAASGLSSLSSAMTAVAFCWLEPLMLKLIAPGSEIPMTTSDTSWLLASIEFGEVLTTIPAGLLADRYGRKPLILSTGPLLLLGWILVLTTRNLPVLYVVRIIQGLSIAIVYTVVPMYIAEISEPRIRGELSTHFQTMWYLGILYIYIIGPLFEYQLYAYLCAIWPLVFTITFMFMPESPYYLCMVKKPEKATTALRWLRCTDDVDVEFQEINRSVEADMSGKGSWRDIVATKKDRKAFLIVQLVCAIKYFNGMPAIVTYATETFMKGSSINPHILTISLGVMLCVTTTCTAFVSDSVGRRPLLLISTMGSVVFNVVIGTYYFLGESMGINLDSYSWVMLASLTGFCISANIGLSPLLQTVQAEYFPSNTRGIGGGITEVTASVTTFINLKQYQIVNDWCGVYMNYFIFAICGLAGFVLLYFTLPETAGQSLAEIQGNAESKPKADTLSECERSGDAQRKF